MVVKDFYLSQTLECGQCFNFEKVGDNEYVVTAFEKVLHVKQTGKDLQFLNASDEDIENIWIPYFDLDRDYGKIKREIIKADERLAPIIKEYGGIRILNQEFNETLISYIISQQNQIPKIKKAVKAISKKAGKEIKVTKEIQSLTDSEFFSFPSPDELSKLSEADFTAMSLGYRAPYLVSTAAKLKSGEVKPDNFYIQDSESRVNENGSKKLIPYEDAKKELLSLKGVGEKVANCVLLFSLGYREAFPVDTWIRKIMLNIYFDSNDKIKNPEIEKFGKEKFGSYGGYAQQYLFIYAKDNHINR